MRGKIIPSDEILQEFEFLCNFFDLPMSSITGKQRKLPITIARHFIAVYFHKHSERKLSSLSVGAIIGNRDHSTILNSCRAIENWTRSDSSMQKKWTMFLNYAKNSSSAQFNNIPQF